MHLKSSTMVDCQTSQSKNPLNISNFFLCQIKVRPVLWIIHSALKNIVWVSYHSVKEFQPCDLSLPLLNCVVVDDRNVVLSWESISLTLFWGAVKISLIFQSIVREMQSHEMLALLRRNQVMRRWAKMSTAAMRRLCQGILILEILYITSTYLTSPELNKRWFSKLNRTLCISSSSYLNWTWMVQLNGSKLERTLCISFCVTL